MAIRTRLFLVMIAGLLLPVALLAALRLMNHEASLGSGNELRLIVQQVDHLGNTERLERLDGNMQEMLTALKEKPERVNDPAFITETEGLLLRSDAGLIVLEHGTSRVIHSTDRVKDRVADMGGEAAVLSDKFSMGFVHRVLYVKQQDGTQYDVMVVSRYPLQSQSKGVLIRYLTPLLAAYSVLFAILAYATERSIDGPMRELMLAAEKVSEGEYAYRIKRYSKDSIGDVSRAFDRMAERLEAADQTNRRHVEERQEMMASISHDLRTPLTVVKMHVAALLEGVADTQEKKSRSLAVIESRIDSIEQMIDELFVYSKLELGQTEFLMHAVDMRRFMEDVLSEWQEEKDPQFVQVQLHASGASPMAAVDGDKMKRVIINILENALRYGGPGVRQIHCTVSSSENTVSIDLADDGYGVPEEELGRLFERFYRGDTSRSSGIPGSGLGLCIAKKIVEGHSGRISVSRASGKGLQIKISLDRVGEER